MATTASELIAQVRRLGGYFVHAEDGWHVRARHPLPDDLVARLAAEKAGIVAALSAPPPLDQDALPGQPCRHCSGLDYWRPSIVAVGESFDPRAWHCHGCTPPPAGLVIDGCSVPQAARWLRLIEAAPPPRRVSPADKRIGS